jgi:hypothetical protein
MEIITMKKIIILIFMLSTAIFADFESNRKDIEINLYDWKSNYEFLIDGESYDTTLSWEEARDNYIRESIRLYGYIEEYEKYMDVKTRIIRLYIAHGMIFHSLSISDENISRTNEIILKARGDEFFQIATDMYNNFIDDADEKLDMVTWEKEALEYLYSYSDEIETYRRVIAMQFKDIVEQENWINKRKMKTIQRGVDIIYGE